MKLILFIWFIFYNSTCFGRSPLPSSGVICLQTVVARPDWQRKEDRHTPNPHSTQTRHTRKYIIIFSYYFYKNPKTYLTLTQNVITVTDMTRYRL